MKEAGDFFTGFKNSLVSGLNTIAIGEIVSFDPVKAKADVMILPDKDLIKSVPVAMPQTSVFMVSLPYNKGDKVVVAFAQRDIDQIMYGGNDDPSKRMLSLDDAIVIGGINLYTSDVTGASSSNLVIGRKGSPSKIILNPDGTCSFNGPSGAKITMDTTGAISIVGPNGVTIQGKTTTESW